MLAPALVVVQSLAAAGEPDLPTLLAEAERANPEILASRARALAASRRPRQAAALPDPLLSVSYTNDGVDDFTLGSSTDTVLALSWEQEMPGRGKRQLATGLALAEGTIAEREAEAVRRRVLSEVKTAWATLYRLDRTGTIVVEARKLLDTFLQAARARYESGEGDLEGVLKAQTGLTRLDAELAVVDGERRAVSARLEGLLGRDDASLEDMPVSAPLEAPEIDAAALRSAAEEGSAELGRLVAQAARGERRVEQAQGALRADWRWEASYQNRGGLDPMVMGLVGVRLPLWKNRKQQEAIEEARWDLDAARNDAAAARARLLAEVRALAARAGQARLRRRLLEEGVLPQARGALDAASAAYSTGRTPFLTLLDDFLAVLLAERDVETQREDEVTAVARLEAITGETLLRQGAAPPQTPGGATQDAPDSPPSAPPSDGTPGGERSPR